MLYFLIIIVSMVVIAVLDELLFAPTFSLELWDIMLAVVISTVVEILISGLAAFVIRWLMPKKWFAMGIKCFTAKKKECLFYEKIGIKKWKDRVVELGCFTNFRKNKISKPTENDYVERFIVESNYGVAIHALSVPLGFLVILIYPLKFWYMFGFPVAIVGAVLNLLPMFILRYNLNKLYRLYDYNTKRLKKTT